LKNPNRIDKVSVLQQTKNFLVCFVFGAILALLPHRFLCAVDLLAAIKEKRFRAILEAILLWLGIALMITLVIWVYFVSSGLLEGMLTGFER